MSPQKAQKPDKKRKPGRPEERVSLKPLELEDALADLLKTPPPNREAKRPKK